MVRFKKGHITIVIAVLFLTYYLMLIVRQKSEVFEFEKKNDLGGQDDSSHIREFKNHYTDEPVTEGLNPPIEEHKLIRPTLRISEKFSETIEKVKLKTVDNLEWQSNMCTPVYFLGGAKAGTTTIAMLLKHKAPDYQKYDPASQFADAGKEPCTAKSKFLKPAIYWSKFKACETTERHLFALDGCPTLYHEYQLEQVARRHPNAKFVMMIREPLTRTLSHINIYAVVNPKVKIESKDSKFYKGVKTVDGYATQMLEKAGSNGPRDLSHYDEIISTFLKYFDASQLLAVQMEHINDHAQEIVDDIMDHIGGQKYTVTPIQANNNGKREKYGRPNDELLRNLDESFADSRKNLREILNYEFTEWDEIRRDKYGFD